MLDIFTSRPCLCPYLQATTVGQLSRLIGALLALSGRLTMVGRARWAGPGGSSRTVQRVCSTGMAGPVRFGVCCRQQVLEPTDTSV
jgi:putative transposase